MAAFLHPGIYVLEAGQPAGTILPAPTSTTIFVGETERGPLTPTLLTSRSDYTRIFGGYLRTNSVTNATSPTLGYAMDAFFNNGGTTCYVLRAMNGSPGAVASRTLPSSPTVKVNASSPGTWANGTTTNGVSVLFFPATDGSASRFRIVIVYTPLDTGVQSIVEDWDRLSIDPNDDNYVVDILNNRSLYIVWDPNTQPAIPTTFDWTGSQPPSPAQILALAATPLTPGSPIGKYGLGSNDNPGSVAGMGGDTDAALADFNFSLLDDIDDAALLVIPRVNDDSTVPSLNDAAIAYVTTRPHLDLFYIGSLSRHNNRTAATDAVKDALDEF